MWESLKKVSNDIKEAAKSSFGDSMGLPLNFTPRAQQILALARKEADRLNHKIIGTEHLLLGLLKLGQGVAVNVFQRIGVNLESVQHELEKETGADSNQEIIGNVNYTSSVKKVLLFASEEARSLKHTYIGTEHILLGLLREGDGKGAKVFKNLGVDIAQTRAVILEEITPFF